MIFAMIASVKQKSSRFVEDFKTVQVALLAFASDLFNTLLVTKGTGSNFLQTHYCSACFV